MPAPVVVYVVAGVCTVGAVIAFHEFVYTPHIAPHIGKWKADFMAKHFPRRGGPVPVSSEAPSPSDSSIPLKRRGGKSSDKSSDTDTDSEDDDNDGDHNGMRQRRARGKGFAAGIANSIELEDLVASELREWRSTTSATSDPSSSLRQRKNRETADHGDVLGESTTSIPYIPMSPTHVLFDSSASATPTSTGTLRSRMSTPPAVESSPLLGSSPPLMSQVSDSRVTLPSPPSTISSSLTSPNQSSSPAQPSPLLHPLLPEYIPSLSQSYPQDLDHEHGLELLSPPSSRSESPFSVLSGSGAANSPWMPVRATPSPFSALPSGVGATSPSARPNITFSLPPILHPQSSDGWFSANPAYQQQQRNQALESSTASVTSQYHSFPSSPAVSGSVSTLSGQGSGLSSPSTLPSPLQDQAASQRSLSALSSPSPITFTSPKSAAHVPQQSSRSTGPGHNTPPRLPLSASRPRTTLVFGTVTEDDSDKEEGQGTPRSPRSPVSPHYRGGELSDLDFMSDLDERSDAGRVSSPHGFFDVGNLEHGGHSVSGGNQVLSPTSQTFLDVRHDGDDPRSPFSDFGDLESENGLSDSGMSDSSWGSVNGRVNGH